MIQETKAGEPVGEVTHTDVLPDLNGMYRHEFLSDSRIPNQAELYLTPPDTESLRRINDELVLAIKKADDALSAGNNSAALAAIREAASVASPSYLDCVARMEKYEVLRQRVKDLELAVKHEADCVDAAEEKIATQAEQIKVARAAILRGKDYCEQVLSGYGFYRPANPHNFHPDPDCSTPEEIANHKAACEAYDAGTYLPDNKDGWISERLRVTAAPWGIGSYFDCDPIFDEALAKLGEQ